MTPQGENLSAHDITVILPAQNGRLVIGLADNGAVVKRLKPHFQYVVNVKTKNTV
jgi:hypothetical protein